MRIATDTGAILRTSWPCWALQRETSPHGRSSFDSYKLTGFNVQHHGVAGDAAITITARNFDDFITTLAPGWVNCATLSNTWVTI